MEGIPLLGRFGYGTGRISRVVSGALQTLFSVVTEVRILRIRIPTT